MKKIFSLLLILCLALSLVGCGEDEPEEKTVEELVDTAYYILNSLENKGTPYQVEQSTVMTSDNSIYNTNADASLNVEGKNERMRVEIGEVALEVTVIDGMGYFMLDNDGEINRYKEKTTDQSVAALAEISKLAKPVEFKSEHFSAAEASYEGDGTWKVSVTSLNESGNALLKEYLASFTSDSIEIVSAELEYKFTKNKFTSVNMDIEYYPDGYSSPLSSVKIETEYSYDEVFVSIPDNAHLYENAQTE